MLIDIGKAAVKQQLATGSAIQIATLQTDFAAAVERSIEDTLRRRFKGASAITIRSVEVRQFELPQDARHWLNLYAAAAEVGSN